MISIISVTKDIVEEIYIKYKSLMMELALQITKNREDAEEAFQDALFSLHRNRHKIKDIDSKDARNYIYTVTKNASLKRRHAQAKHRSQSYYDNDNYIKVENEIDNQAFCNEYGFSEEISFALDRLKSEDRDLICYYYGLGYSYREISKLMGVESSTLRKRMSRVKETLAEIISRENEEK